MSDQTFDLTNDMPDNGPDVESFEALFFLALQDYLQTALPGVFKTIDLDLGQLDLYEERPAVSFPCLLVDFVDSSFDNMGQLIQWAKPQIQFKIGFSPYSASDATVPLKWRKKAIGHFELEYKLYKALQGFTAGGICQPLIRVRSITQQRDDVFRVRVLIFDTTYQDEGAAAETTAVRPTMQFD